MKHSIRDELTGILALIGLIWVVFLVDLVLPPDLAQWGVIPRTLGGLVGIVTMPLLHGSFAHLMSNTVPLLVLLCLLAGSRANSIQVLALIWLLSGALLWSFGRTADHIGASGLVYGLVAFLLVAGIIERRLVSIAVAIITGLIYGGSLLAGVLPSAGPQVSWDGHLCGAVAGALVTQVSVSRGRRKP